MARDAAEHLSYRRIATRMEVTALAMRTTDGRGTLLYGWISKSGIKRPKIPLQCRGRSGKWRQVEPFAESAELVPNASVIFVGRILKSVVLQVRRALIEIDDRRARGRASMGVIRSKCIEHAHAMEYSCFLITTKATGLYSSSLYP